MNQTQYDKFIEKLNNMSDEDLAKSLLKHGIISEEDYSQITLETNKEN